MRTAILSAATLFFLIITLNTWCSTINPGDIFISVVGNNTVIQINGEGYTYTYATGLDEPVGLAFSPDGQLFVVERESGEVTNITSGGNFTNSNAHSWGFLPNSLRNLLIDNNGRILVANRDEGTVVDITVGGHASSSSIFAYRLSGTRDIFQTSTGSIYAVEEYSGEVTEITVGGNFTTATPFASGFSVPYALAESPDNHLFLVEALSGNVYDITSGGYSSTIFASNLGIVDEIIFNGDGAFLTVQEYYSAIIDISAGGPGPFELFAEGLGPYPQQIAIAPSSISTCLYDINDDGAVDDHDLSILVNELGFNNCSQMDPCQADFMSDGDVDGLDLYNFTTEYGEVGCL